MCENQDRILPSLQSISKNTNINVWSDAALKKMRSNFEVPQVVKTNYLLETYLLDVLDQIETNETTGVTFDNWMEVLEDVVDNQGFHVGMIKSIWSLTRILEFKLALESFCRKRLTIWKSKSPELKSFYDVVKPNLSSRIYSSDPIKMVSQIYLHTELKGLNYLDEIGSLQSVQHGWGLTLFSTFPVPLGESSISRIDFSPFWIPLNFLNVVESFAVIPIWMLSWLDWDQTDKTKVMSKNGSGWNSLMNKNEFLDVLNTHSFRNPIYRQMTNMIFENKMVIMNFKGHKLSKLGLEEIMLEAHEGLVRAINEIDKPFDLFSLPITDS